MDFLDTLLFASTLVCFGAAVLSYRKARLLLLERHPDKFVQIEKSSSWPSYGLQRFIYWGDHKEVGDKAVSDEVISTRVLLAAGFGSFLARSFF